MWDRNAEEFDYEVRDTCTHLEDDEEHKTDRHAAADLWLNLDDCWPCDDSATVNFTYGYLHSITEVALKLGVTIEVRFPKPLPRD